MLTADNISNRIDGITGDEIARKKTIIPECFKGLRNMERLIERLPRTERNRFRMVLAEELKRLEGIISVEVSNRLLADEIENAHNEIRKGNGEALHAVMSKQLAMVMGE